MDTVILRPSSANSESICRIVINRDRIELVSCFDDKLITLVKSLGYSWCRSSHVWKRDINHLAGSIDDRATELGCHLLSSGFTVELPNQEICKKTVNRDYKLEHTQWILVGHGKYDSWFRLWWKRSENDFWNTSRNFLTDNRYDHKTKCICVPSEHYAEIEDFAQINDFKFSDKALELLNLAKEQRINIIVVDIQRKKKAKVKIKPVTKSVSINRFSDLLYRSFLINTTTKLYPYQISAVNKVLPVFIGALFMEMGTGKTRTAIEMACKRQYRISNVVWFCPVSLKDTVVYEIRKHTNTPENQIIKFDDKTNKSDLGDAFWYVVGIESMSSSNRVVLTVDSIIDEYSFVIVDESDYIKGHNSTRTKRITDISSKAKYRLILTGTPISQGYEDLFAQMRFLSSGILGYHSFYSFAANHLEYSEEYPGLIVRTHNTKWLTSKMQPYIYQITKEDAGLNLPKKLYDRQYFFLSQEQRDAYEQAKIEILSTYDNLNTYAIFQLFSALQQIVSGFWNRDNCLIEYPHHRLDQLKSIVDSLPNNEKVIIWCKFTYSIHQIANMLSKAYDPSNVSQYYGGLDENKRTAQLLQWRSKTRFLVISAQSGGRGLTLNESIYSIFYENEFKYGNRLQAEDRNHRIGQKERPTYIDILAKCGIEERIMNSHAKKGDIVTDFQNEVNRFKDLDQRQLKEFILKSL